MEGTKQVLSPASLPTPGYPASFVTPSRGLLCCRARRCKATPWGLLPLFSSLPRGPEGPAALPALPSHPLKTLLPGSLLPPCLPFPVTSACPEVTCCPAGLSVLDTPSSSTQGSRHAHSVGHGLDLVVPKHCIPRKAPLQSTFPPLCPSPPIPLAPPPRPVSAPRQRLSHWL